MNEKALFDELMEIWKRAGISEFEIRRRIRAIRESLRKGEITE